jgi:hypothetical protein
MNIDIEKLMEIILNDADKRAENAGYGGSHSDGGASRLRDQVKFYKAGINGTIPTEWNDYLTEYVRNTDPEFSEYVRLKEKFEK